MDQEKIGKFIAKLRKEKNLTQEQFAEKIGVTAKSISRWENGKTMPDISLFKPLCKELDITINDLISGEKITKDTYQEKLEENILNTIDYSTKKLNKYSRVISLVLIIIGLFISISAITIFPSESSWGSIYSIFGIIIFICGISRITKEIKWYKRLLLIFVIFVLAMGILFFTDYINVKLNDQAPMYRTRTITIYNVILYDTPFYDVYRCNFDTEDEYWVIEKNRKYDDLSLMNYCK